MLQATLGTHPRASQTNEIFETVKCGVPAADAGLFLKDGDMLIVRKTKCIQGAAAHRCLTTHINPLLLLWGTGSILSRQDGLLPVNSC